MRTRWAGCCEFRVDDDSLSTRDKAIMELFYSSGLRLSELVNLDIGAVDLPDRTVRVLRQGQQNAPRPMAGTPSMRCKNGSSNAPPSPKRPFLPCSRSAKACREPSAVSSPRAPHRFVAMKSRCSLDDGRLTRPGGADARGLRGHAAMGLKRAYAPAHVPPFVRDRICSNPARICAEFRNCWALRYQHHANLYAFGLSTSGEGL